MCRDLGYFKLFLGFGIGPVLDSLFDFGSGDGREVYASVLTRKAAFCLLFPFTQHMCAGISSLPLTMLPLPGLLVYAIRCLLSRQWLRLGVELVVCFNFGRHDALRKQVQGASA